jgi:hypothetical protein
LSNDVASAALRLPVASTDPLCVQLAGIQVSEINPDAFFAGHQMNAVGVHPAQRAGIHRHRGGAAFTLLRLYAAICANPVGPGNHL